MTSEPLRFEQGEYVGVGYVADLYELLHAIDLTMPKDAILYLEGNSIVPEVRDFLASHEASARREVERNTAWPRPKTFHLPLEGTNLSRLRELADHHAEPEVCDHLVIYRDDVVLLWAHDAGAGYVEVTQSLPDETLDRFRRALGAALLRDKPRWRPWRKKPG